MFDTIGTSITNIEKVALPKGSEISKKNFVTGDAFKNKVSLNLRILIHRQMRTAKHRYLLNPALILIWWFH